jgi:hypothetical protein
MKKLLVLLLLVPLLAQAAKWTKLGTAGGVESFLDKTSIIKNERGTKAWSLLSYATPQATPDGLPYLSMKVLQLYSCAERTTTLLTQVYYSEAMGKGDMVRSFKYEKFEADDVIPDSAADGALQIICHAKR